MQMDRLDGDKTYSPEDEELQKIITELYQKYSGYGDMGRMGNAFVHKYEDMILM